MKTSIIIIGNEILSGRTRDANGHFLSNWLKEMGLHNRQMIIVPDESQAVRKALEEAWNDSDLVITTGGLGPTLDDMTKEILAENFKTPIKECPKAKELTIGHYERIKREWNPELNHYHMIPEGFEAVENPAGLAPGLLKFDQNKLLLSAPGVPRELRAMANTIWPHLLDRFFSNSRDSQQTITIRTKGLPEEKIFSLMPDFWETMSKYGKPSSLPQTMGIDLVITLDQKHTTKRSIFIAELKEYIEKSPIADNVWQWGEEDLPTYLLNQAREKNLTIGLAESCTGGLIGKQLTDIPGCSDVFIGSVVSYHNDAKVSLLGVSEETLKTYGAVSAETALEMAKGVHDSLHCDLGLSITGIAGPGGGTADKPVGTVHMAVATREKLLEKKFNFKFFGDRKLIRERFAHQALFLLLDTVKEY